jgi:hypothetical protein
MVKKAYGCLHMSLSVYSLSHRTGGCLFSQEMDPDGHESIKKEALKASFLC